MRNVTDVLKADSGREIFIFEVKKYKLHIGDMYECEYKVGASTEMLTSRLIDTTADDRTLIFNHPTLVNRTIGIPNWNIVKLSRL
jgi:hypothetical protein